MSQVNRGMGALESHIAEAGYVQRKFNTCRFLYKQLMWLIQ